MSGPGNAVPAMAGTGPGSDRGPRHPRKTRAHVGTSDRQPGLPGWERLRHGGFLLDARRLATLSRYMPGPSTTVSDGSCGNARARYRMRIRTAAPSCCSSRSCWGWSADSTRVHRHLDARKQRLAFLGAARNHRRDGEAPPSVDRQGRRAPAGVPGRRLGVGRGRRGLSRVLGWLRAGNDHLALLTNGRQWRLLFAGLDYDAWCEWVLDL